MRASRLRAVATVLLLTSFLAGCSVRLHRDRDGDRPNQQFAAGSLRAFIKQTNPYLSPDMIDRIADALVRECDKQGLDVRVVAALISHESSFNTKAVSPSGAIGLGQLLPSTAKWLGVQDPYDPEQNIAGICKYLIHLRDRWAKGLDWTKILASYRLGQMTVQQSLQSTGTIPQVGLDYARDILGRASRIKTIG